MSNRFLLLSIFYFTFFLLRAQDIKVSTHFSTDSVKAGEPVDFYLVAKHGANMNILFPDSTYAFTPFEILNKRYMATHTIDGVSYDSAIYTLATYEIDPVQTLKLPVFILQKKDCVTVYSQSDTVYFKNVVKAVADSVKLDKLPLKTNIDYWKVKWQLNYLLVSIIGGVLLVVLIVVWIIFGKRIRRYFVEKRLFKNHQLFLQQYNTATEKVKENFSPALAEAAVLIWKRYLETMSEKPYTKYTSKEIIRLEKDAALGNALHTIDRMVYGRINESSWDAFTFLKEYSEKQFEKKKEELKGSAKAEQKNAEVQITNAELKTE